MEKKEISDDCKLFLRAVLVSAPGMRQSQILKEYTQLIGERLEYSKFGYKNLYEFLVALEGDVTRLEFNPKYEENVVYSVIDKTKYASEHAKKYANKVKTGMKSKSPEEIIEWKKQNGREGTLPPVVVKRTRKRNNSNHARKVHKVEPKGREGLPTVSEWAALRRLLPESQGVFTLNIRNIGVNQKKEKFNEKALYVHFAPYNVISKSCKHSPSSTPGGSFISFPSFFTAYRAWKEKDKTIVMGNRIGIEPAGGNLKSLNCDLHMIFVINIPTGVLMSSFVTVFAKYAGLVCIDARPREQCAIITYSSLESAKRACSEVTTIIVNGRKQPLNVQILEERPSMSFGAVNTSLLKSSEHKSEINAVKKELPKEETQPNISRKPASPVSTESQRATPVESETKEDADLCNLRACRFCINYQQFFQMFQITCRKKPNTIENISDEVQFLVTHQIDAIRFWGWLMCDTHESVKKLSEIEKNLSMVAAKVQPPHVLPKEGHRGAALYKEDGKESWYRCYVLSSNTEADQIHVCYCDYGNSEVISRELFRSTYNDVWTLPPQAVPFKMYGYELKNTKNVEISERLFLEDGQILKASVVKSSVYSQPHIIEIRNVSRVAINSNSIDESILGSWCIPVGDTYEGDDLGGDIVDTEANAVALDVEKSSEDVSETCVGDIDDDGAEDSVDGGVTSPDPEEKTLMESIFDYDEDDLVLGLLAAAHNPSLLYLKLGDVSQFAILQIALDKAELMFPKNLDKGDTLLLNQNGQRRRVLVLQVLPAFQKVKVLHVDFGTIEWVSIKDLHNLNRDLKESPFQARPATLAGIECKERMEEAISYLKTKTKIVIKTNVIHESSSGKISVELFDLQSNISINKEMIDNGLAFRIVNEFNDTDEELSPSQIPLPVKELDTHIPQTGLLPFPQKQPEPPRAISSEIETILNALKLTQPQDNISVASWNSQPNNPFVCEPVQKNILPLCPDVPKLMDVTTWLNQSPIKGSAPSEVSDITTNFSCFENANSLCSGAKSQRVLHGNENHKNNEMLNNNFILNRNEGNGSDNRSVSSSGRFPKGRDSSFPQPDIVASNKVNEIQVDQGIDITGRTITIGDDNDILSVDKSNRLSSKEIDDIRKKWEVEKKLLVETKRRVESLLRLSNEDLNTYYKEKKKEKLQQKLKIKQSQKYSSKLESEYESIVQETNHILSLI